MISSRAFETAFFACDGVIMFLGERQRSGDAPLVARTQQRIVGSIPHSVLVVKDGAC